VLGPLPPLHRWVVCALALLACLGLGASLAVTLPAPRLATAGAALGVLVVVLLLHDPTRHRREPRMRTRRPH